jgi:hypothetical protein
MKSEMSVINRQASSMHSIPEETVSRRTSVVLPEVVMKEQQEEPEVTSFPFVESTNGASKRRDSNVKAIDAKDNIGHKHGAKLCTLSAMVHMKIIASKRAKSIKQLRRNPKTTLDDKNKLNELDSDSDENDENDGPLSYLNNCRYLRGTKEDQELSIEDIFG